MILDDIVRDKRVAVQRAKTERTVADLQRRPLFAADRRSLRAALAGAPRAIIAEVKRASPSKGVIRADFDALAIARAYADHGAAAISILTEERYFQGRIEYLAAIRAEVSVPLLRKDFIFDHYQLIEARAFGADAVLLIVAILEDAELGALLAAARELGLTALVEVHDRAELDRAARAGAGVIGINNRDLRTFATTLKTTEELVAAAPPGACVVAESGIESVADLQRLERAGVRAFLIGETFMRAADPGRRLAEFVAAPSGAARP